MYPEGTTTISVYQSQSAWFSSFPPLSGLLPLQLALLWLVLAPLQIQNRIRNQNKTYQRHLVPVPLRKKQLQLLQVSSPLQLLLLLFRQQVLSELFPRPNRMRKRIFHNSNTFSSIISCFFTSFLFLFALFAICQQIINNGSITKEINEAVQQNFWHTKCTNNHGYFKKEKSQSNTMNREYLVLFRWEVGIFMIFLFNRNVYSCLIIFVNKTQILIIKSHRKWTYR